MCSTTKVIAEGGHFGTDYGFSCAATVKKMQESSSRRFLRRGVQDQHDFAAR